MLWPLLGVFLLGLSCSLPVAWWVSRLTAARERELSARAHESQRLAEAQALRAERLAEMGTLTSGLAHEIKNPLSSVNLNSQLLQEDLREIADLTPPGTEAGVRLGRILRRFDGLAHEVQRLRDILDDFLRFAGRLKLDPAPTNLGDLAGELADFFSPQAQASGVNLRIHAPTTPVVALVDPGHLKQSLLNLLINATQAMENARKDGVRHGGSTELILRIERVPGAAAAAGFGAGGPPTVEAEAARPGGLDGDERDRILAESKGGGFARIHVIDTGPGIAAEDQLRAFQPYYSTKKGGTGLGLPTARRIVQMHGGTLTVHSEPGRGSDFVITLAALPEDHGMGNGLDG